MKSKTIQLQRQVHELRQQLELKNNQIEDLQFSLNAFRKQQSIWEHLNQQPKSNENALQEQNQKLKSQLIGIINEKQLVESQIFELKQKVTDLKYTNQELKKINEKSNTVYQRQIQILRSQKTNQQQMHTLKQQKQRLQSTLAKCQQIAKEMEEFYMNQIQTLTSNNQQQKLQIESLKKENNCLKNSKIQKQEVKMRESVIEELIKVQNQEKRWELMLEQQKQHYEREIAELKDKIKFLIVKLESVQDAKYEPTFSNSLMTQSKMVMSSATTESFRFTPNNSFACSIKESLSRRDTNSMKTPNKYKNMKSFGKYLENA